MALAVSANARAEEPESPRAAKVMWTDHNTHDPGRDIDPTKVQEMLVDLAEEEAARHKRKPRDQWLLQSFGVGPQADSR